ncbi:uncharacterized protein CELE_B0281.1 [Caenorhabditis elegans]|uniref:Uncharacterized protein n=1 Tax=Caenorhabditis elegans TaxID=6239 RepID=O16617_CAEEL|nr:Uncharacterized protein CELE_B0281.1 [Caenorhabditis elegans]CCD61634.2 Uncharacterized protein CELE_B0281.1 [Caenorhabditis elegans]
MYTSIKCSTIYPNKINIPYIAHSSPFQIDSSQFQDIGSLCLIKKFINASPCFLVPIAFHMSLCPKREISNYLSANENVVNKPNELGRKLDSELEKLKTSLLKTKKLQEKLERAEFSFYKDGPTYERRLVFLVFRPADTKEMDVKLPNFKFEDGS